MTRAEPALSSSCSSIADLGFHVGRFDVTTSGKLDFPEGAVKPTLENPNAIATADVCARPKTAAAQAELANWTVGISRTIYEDYALYAYDKSDVVTRFSEVSGGGVLDVDDGFHGVPFDDGIGRAGGAVQAARIDHKPTQLQVADAPSTEFPMANPLDHKDCDPPDRIRAIIRLMDFSTFLMARNDLTHEVCTLRHIAYRQISQVRFTDAGGKTKDKLGDGQALVEDRLATTTAHGQAEVYGSGEGEGSRPAELTRKNGSMANEIIAPPVFVEKQEC